MHMRVFFALVFIGMLSSSSFSSAQLQAITIAPDLETLPLDTIKEMINQRIASAPSYVKDFVKNDIVHLYVDDMLLFHAVFQDSQIVTLERGPHASPTINMYVTTATIMELVFGERDFSTSIQDGSIRIEGVGFFNSIRVGFSNLILGILRFFD